MSDESRQIVTVNSRQMMIADNPADNWLEEYLTESGQTVFKYGQTNQPVKSSKER